MNIRIGLEKSDYLCLFAKVPETSDLRRVFQPRVGDGVGIEEISPGPGLPFGDDVSMWCSREDAKQLLEIAKQHCKGAVDGIQQALRGLP